MSQSNNVKLWMIILPWWWGGGGAVIAHCCGLNKSRVRCCGANQVISPLLLSGQMPSYMARFPCSSSPSSGKHVSSTPDTVGAFSLLYSERPHYRWVETGISNSEAQCKNWQILPSECNPPSGCEKQFMSNKKTPHPMWQNESVPANQLSAFSGLGQ